MSFVEVTTMRRERKDGMEPLVNGWWGLVVGSWYPPFVLAQFFFEECQKFKIDEQLSGIEKRSWEFSFSLPDNARISWPKAS